MVVEMLLFILATRESFFPTGHINTEYLRDKLQSIKDGWLVP